MAESTADERDLYRRWIDELWNGPSDREKLLEVAEELVSEEFVGHWPNVEVVGPGKLAALIAATKATFKDIEFEIVVPPFADGGFVAGRWIGTGTGVAGESSQFAGNDILSVHDGKFTEYWVASAGG
ncbi:ester cyclase [Gordonia zhaorongruii]|uniref:ester cyclase n=1 Tax=Gordonia zhaorongruii TaxID=2597659 RepID=UPI0010534FFB|nr:nuclear transport factor 2 family protein [Gordonia zhaorongruii]